MAFPNLRNDNNLIAFNRKLQECGWDLRKWRAGIEKASKDGKVSKELEEGFEVLDLEEGAGWELACQVSWPAGDGNVVG